MTRENARWNQVPRQGARLNVVEIGEWKMRCRSEHSIRRGLVDESQCDDCMLQWEARGERVLMRAVEAG